MIAAVSIQAFTKPGAGFACLHVAEIVSGKDHNELILNSRRLAEQHQALWEATYKLELIKSTIVIRSFDGWTYTDPFCENL